MVVLTTPKAARNKLIKQIQKANGLIPDTEAGRIADMILSFEPVKPKPPGYRHKMTFGKYAGKFLDEAPSSYVKWLSELVEEKRHPRVFLEAIRAARAEVLSWQVFTAEQMDCPFDC